MGDRRLSLVTLVLALLLLNVSLTFLNWWPTPAIRWTGQLSVEFAVVTLGLALAHRAQRPPSRPALFLLSAGWLLLVLGRYVSVTAPALWGRELNFYWDLRFLPDVAAMVAGAARPALVAGAVIALVAVAVAAYAVVRWSLGRLNASLLSARPRRLLLTVSIALVAMYSAQRLIPALPRVPVFAVPVLETYGRQVQFVLDARRGSRRLPPSPSFSSNLSRLGNADVLLFFIESYGAVTYEQPVFNAALASRRAALEAAIQASGDDVASAFVESPTFGGSSWFAHITLLSGLAVRDPDTNALLMTEQRETLPMAFGRHGYRAVAMMPGLWYPWPEGAFYGFDEIYNGQRLDYKGPPFGWWAMPDQFTLAKLDELEMERPGRPPLFVFFPTVSTHTPFGPTPEFQPDWPRMFTDQPWDYDDVERAWETPVEWTNLGPSYTKSVNYAYDTLAGYLAKHKDGNFVMIVLGDHQPPALVSGEGAPWDVPVHVITNRTEVLTRLKANGFGAGLTPTRPSLGSMERLVPLLLDAFGDSAK